jgi:DNA-binding CsgD family transcriptional regulator
VATQSYNAHASSPISARCCDGGIGACRRENCCARPSASPAAWGARPLAQRTETELRATGARPRRVVLTGLESLTASERRIAELASDDLTNREIAQTLFITDRTVEGHAH